VEIERPEADAGPAVRLGPDPRWIARDRIYPVTRALAGLIVPFLLLGIYVLYIRTDQTRQLWAWQIRSPMSALILASAYAAGAYYFGRAVFARRWHHIGRGLLPVLAFATLMGVVTLVHWQLFIHDNIAFTLWVALYFTTPMLVAAAWWFNRRQDTGRPDEPDEVIPHRVRRASGGIGSVGLVAAGLSLLAPEPLIDSWAWPLTPLTARVLCVIFILFNVYLISLSFDARWSAARINIESLVVALVLISVGIARTRDTFIWSRPSAWLFLIGVVAALIASVGSLLWAGRRRPAASRHDKPDAGQPDETDKVCVIGAGSSGIAACQVLHTRGISYDCFEAGSQVGGNWRYLNDNRMSSAYRSLHINTSRKVMEYAAFPMPNDLPDYPNHTQIAAYFDSYVDHFGIRPTITFRTEVTRVEPADPGWFVTTRHRDTGEVSRARYRAVLVANGHHWDPRYPEPPFPGTFSGQQTHSHDYKVPDPYAGRRVLVVGIGNSATDIAVETSSTSARTLLSMRRGAHVIPKYLFGQPFDRLAKTPLARAPLWLQRLTLRTLLRVAQGRMTDYGLPKPDHKILSAHPTISSDLLNRLGHGDITVKGNVERLDGERVWFVDGTAEQIDAIIYCTGYKISFPFLDPEIIAAHDNKIDLFHRVVDPDHAGLFFIGLVQPLGAIMPLAEAQSEWVADLLEGKAELPTAEEAHREISRYARRTAGRYLTSKRHTIEVDFLAYLREIERERRRGARRAAGLRRGHVIPRRSSVPSSDSIQQPRPVASTTGDVT
jgi:dimethylaniline monooxygenase (N-oxide forming)